MASRISCLVPLVLLTLPLVHAHEGSRKSLSFKQSLPHAQFIIDPPSISAPIPADAHPHYVAKLFLKEHVLGDSANYYIRNDSYTDQKSGISHVYVQQLEDGLVVADGRINLNIRDKKVLSFGNSFHNRSVSKGILDSPSWNQEIYCNRIPPNHDPFACNISLDRVRRAASSYATDFSTHQDDPRAAAYFFMVASYPEDFSFGTYVQSVTAVREPCPQPSSTFASDCWAISGLPGILAPIQARKVYVQTSVPSSKDTSLNLAWYLEVVLEDNRYEAYVSVDSPSQIISSVDWVIDAPPSSKDGQISLQKRSLGQKVFALNEAGVTGSGNPAAPSDPSSPPGGTYRVWKWGINAPDCGNRTLEVSPYNKNASQLGWHSVPAPNDPVKDHPGVGVNTLVNFTTTIGNNVIAQSCPNGGYGWERQPRPDGGKDLVFDFAYGADPWEVDWEKVQPAQYINTSVTQVFYVANMFHDLMYQYGFDEPSGNFQQYNFGKGGAEGDALIVDAQVSRQFNDAFTMVPPDGKHGNIRMGVWNEVVPFRDGALDAGTFVHELTHGLSGRLTGGPSVADCLGSGEPGGLSEGWSDFVAAVVQSTRVYRDYPVGAWAGGKPGGLRTYPYATNNTTNPLTYDFLQRLSNSDIYLMGEVWAEILWVVFNKLVERHGFADSLFPSTEHEFYHIRTQENGSILLVPKHGNTLMLQLVINAMKLQPCSPRFIQARDAIIAADRDLTGGQNKCLLWDGFASRGLGTDAKDNSTIRGSDNSISGVKVPLECQL